MTQQTQDNRGRVLPGWLRDAVGTLAAAARRFARTWLPGFLILLVMSLLSAMVTALALALVPPFAEAQLSLILDPSGRGVSVAGMALLALELGVPSVLLIGLIAASGFGALIRMFDDVRQGGRPQLGRDLLQGIRRSPRTLGAVALHLALVVLLFVAAPFLVPAGLIGIAVVAVLHRRGRAPHIPLRVFVVAAIPFGASAVVLVRGALAGAFTVLEGSGPIRALRRSWSATGRAALPAACAVLVAFVVYLLLHFGISLLVPDGAPDMLVSVGLAALQAATFGFPLAVVAVLARRLRDDAYPIEVAPSGARRWRRAVATATVALMAVTSGAIAPVAATPAFAAVSEEAPPETPQETPQETPPESPPGEGSGEAPSEGGEEEPGVPGRVDIDDPRFQATFIVREGTSTVEGDPVTLWVTASSSDATPTVTNFVVDYFVLDANDVWQPLGDHQYSSWYAASSLSVDLDAHPLPAGIHRFGARLHNPFAAGGPRQGPWVETYHTVDAGATATTTTLTTGVAQAFVDDTVPFQVVVTAADSSTPAGWVQVQVTNGTGLPDVWLQLDASGRASGSVKVSNAGNLSLTATYRGAPPLTTSSAPTVQLTVSKLPVSVALVQSSSSSTVGEEVVFTATATGPQGEAPAAESQIEFRLGDPVTGTVLGTAAQDQQGVARLTSSALPVGAASVYAVYLGSYQRYARGVSAPVTHGVGVAPVTLTIAAPGGLTIPRGLVTELLVDAVVATGVPPLTQGTITVTVDGTATAYPISSASDLPLTVPVTMGDADVVVTAELTSSPTHAASGSAQTTVTRRASATTVQLHAPQLTLPGTPHVVSASVSGEYDYDRPDSGTLEYRLDGGSWQPIALSSSSTNWQLVLGIGEHTVDARFVTDAPAAFTSSPIASVAFAVGLVPTTVLATPPALVRVDEQVAVAVAVGEAGPYFAPTTGTVVIEDASGTVLGSAELSGSSSATVTLAGLPAGITNLTARFAGNSQYASSSASFSFPVLFWPSSLSLEAPTNGAAGEPLSLRATVTSTMPGAAAHLEGASVRFTTTGGLDLGTATLDASGLAELSARLPARSSQHQVMATFLGAAGAIDGSSDATFVYIEKAGTSVSVTFSPASAAVGQQVEMRIQVTSASDAPLADGTFKLTGDFHPDGLQVRPEETGIASYFFSAPAPGITPTVNVEYTGSSQLYGSYATGQLTLRKAAVTVTLTPPQGEVHAGTTATVRVLVTAEAGATPPSYGTVILRSGGTVIGSQNLTSPQELSFALDASVLGLGSHPIVAEYSGGAAYDFATSDPSTVDLVGYETGVLLEASPQGFTMLDGTVMFTAIVDTLGRADIPTGSVMFEIDGATHGPVALAPIGGTGQGSDRSVARLNLSTLPIGTHTVHAVYSPDTTDFASSTSAALSHEVRGAVATVTSTLPLFVAGRPASIPVTVTGTSSAPLGSVTLWIDDQQTTVSGLLTPSSPLAQVTLQVPGSLVTAGEHSYSLRYTPDDGVHAPGRQDATLVVAKGAPTITIGTLGVPAQMEWNAPVSVVVTLAHDPADPFGLAPLPTGAPTVTLLGGPACTSDGTRFTCTPERAGPVTVNVAYAGDGNYEQASRQLVITQAVKRTAHLTAGLTPVTAESGQTVTLNWDLVGPAVRPTIEGLPVGSQCTGVASGSCTFSFTPAEAEQPHTIAVRYVGDTDWVGAEWTQPLTVAPCYPLTSPAVPAEGGTVVVETAPNCANGGYRAGTTVRVRVTPSTSGDAGFQWRLVSIGDRPVAEQAPALHQFVVGTGSGRTTSIIAVFEKAARCVTVTTVMSTIGSSFGGDMTLAQQPNCPGGGDWSVTSAANRTGGRDISWSARFLIGTTISSRTPFAQPGFQYYGLTVGDGTYQAQGALTRTLTDPLTVTALFGPACYPLELAVRGSGKLEALTTGMCPDQARRDQYLDGTTVTLRATPDAKSPLAYLRTLGGVAEPAKVVGSNAAERRAGVHAAYVTIQHGPARAEAVFETCLVIRVQPQYRGTANGTVSTTLTSNCPVGPTSLPDRTWHVTPGTPLVIDAIPDGMRTLFSRWNTPGSNGDRTSALVDAMPKFIGTAVEDMTLRPAFVPQYMCIPFVAGAGSPGIEASFTLDDDALSYCPGDGSLRPTMPWSSGSASGKVAGGTATGVARSTSGRSLVGWQVSEPGGSYGIPGANVSFTMREQASFGSNRLEAFACQEVVPFFSVIDLAGEPHVGRQDRGDFIQISPAANCPYNPLAWVVGTELTFTAGADARGFAFQNWEGVAGTGTELTGDRYVVTDTAPKAALLAVYQMVCRELTITGKPHRVTRLPEPNCMGGPEPALADGVYTGWYIGGTPVALFGEVPGGNVWQGWSGDVEEAGKVEAAVVVMDRDKSVAHRYRSKDWQEKSVDFFNEAGNQLAIAAKKAVGGLAYAANQAFSYVPPISLVSAALGVVSKVGEMLESIGVPSSITKYFDYPAQTYQWITDQYLCVAAWGLSGGSASVFVGDYTDPLEDQVFGAIDDVVGSVNDFTGGGLGAVGGMAGVGGNGGSGEDISSGYGDLGDLASFYELGGGDLGSWGAGLGYLDTAIVSYKLLTNPQGLGWDNNMHDAWSFENYSERMMGCSDAAMPQFLRDELLSERTDEEWAELERKYGL